VSKAGPIAHIQKLVNKGGGAKSYRRRFEVKFNYKINTVKNSSLVSL